MLVEAKWKEGSVAWLPVFNQPEILTNMSEHCL